MRIKIMSAINSKEEFKEKFISLIDQLPIDLEDYQLTGMNLYFNIQEKGTGCKVELLDNNERIINYYQFGKEKTKKKKLEKQLAKQGKIIPFSPPANEEKLINS